MEGMLQKRIYLIARSLAEQETQDHPLPIDVWLLKVKKSYFQLAVTKPITEAE